MKLITWSAARALDDLYRRPVRHDYGYDAPARVVSRAPPAAPVKVPSGQAKGPKVHPFTALHGIEARRLYWQCVSDTIPKSLILTPMLRRDIVRVLILHNVPFAAITSDATSQNAKYARYCIAWILINRAGTARPLVCKLLGLRRNTLKHGLLRLVKRPWLIAYRARRP